MRSFSVLCNRWHNDPRQCKMPPRTWGIRGTQSSPHWILLFGLGWGSLPTTTPAGEVWNGWVRCSTDYAFWYLALYYKTLIAASATRSQNTFHQTLSLRLWNWLTWKLSGLTVSSIESMKTDGSGDTSAFTKPSHCSNSYILTNISSYHFHFFFIYSFAPNGKTITDLMSFCYFVDNYSDKYVSDLCKIVLFILIFICNYVFCNYWMIQSSLTEYYINLKTVLNV